MFIGQGHNESLCRQYEVLDVGERDLRNGVTDDGDIEVLGADGIDLREDGHLMQRYPDSGVLLAVGLQLVREARFVHHGTDQTDVDLPRLASCHVSRYPRGFLCLREGGLCFLQERRAGFREFHPALGAQEQPRAQLLLQSLDLLAECRLRDPQFLGRTRKMQFFGRSDEIAELSKIHEA